MNSGGVFLKWNKKCKKQPRKHKSLVVLLVLVAVLAMVVSVLFLLSDEQAEMLTAAVQHSNIASIFS